VRSFIYLKFFVEICIGKKSSLSIQRISSVKIQLIYRQLKWQHVSTQRVIIRPIIEPCLRYIKWKCTFLGSQNVYNRKRAWIQKMWYLIILYTLTHIHVFL